MALTGKKKAFAEAVLAGRSNKEAAILAGYSAKTASAAGSRLAKDPGILEYLNHQVREMAKAEQKSTAPLGPGEIDLRADTPIVWSDPKSFLLAVMNHKYSDLKHRIDAAKALLPYEHARKDQIGKKEEREQYALTAEDGSDWAGLLQTGLPQ